jgi:tetratricopeptide (TPR) repeat protein
LKETLEKYPESALYVQSLLGVEYVKTERFQDAVGSFEQAVSLLPHDAMTHYNFGLSLACAGDYTRAEQETRRALELDPKIEDAHMLMSVLEQRKTTGN